MLISIYDNWGKLRYNISESKRPMVDSGRERWYVWQVKHSEGLKKIVPF